MIFFSLVAYYNYYPFRFDIVGGPAVDDINIEKTVMPLIFFEF